MPLRSKLFTSSSFDDPELRQAILKVLAVADKLRDANLATVEAVRIAVTMTTTANAGIL
jgi:hypothetical protein